MKERLKRFAKESFAEKEKDLYKFVYGFFNRRKFGKLGKYSYIMDPLVVTNRKYCFIGEHVDIWKNARIEVIEIWNGEKRKPKLQIGNHCSFGQGLHLTCGDDIKVEDYVTCTGNVTITDIMHVYENIELPILKQPIVCKPVIIGEHCFLGMGSVILPGVILGKRCIVGANAVVTKSIPDYCVVAGNPAKIIKKYNIDTGKWEKVCEGK
jgi:acetyltransferase-like isoleucine patch superfamily enzyme